jgi:hypothetical protein
MRSRSAAISNSGQLDAVRVGQRIRVPREALDKLLQPARPDQAVASETEEPSHLKEELAVYDIRGRLRISETLQAVVGGVATQLVRLPAEDVLAVARIVTRLYQPRQEIPQPRLTSAEIVAAARQGASLLDTVPRAEIAARFEALVQEIRLQAVGRNTAIEGDWLGD